MFTKNLTVYTNFSYPSLSITILVIGIYAGILGIIHGIGEILQGNSPTTSLLIYAFNCAGAPEDYWHACLPAMTLIPNYLFSGIIVIIFSLIQIYWVIFRLSKPKGYIVQFIVALVMILVGAGFYSGFYAILCGIFSIFYQKEPKMIKSYRFSALFILLSKLWPYTLIIFFLMSLFQWAFGMYFNNFLLSISSVTFVVEWGLVFLSFICSLLKDTARREIR